MIAKEKTLAGFTTELAGKAPIPGGGGAAALAGALAASLDSMVAELTVGKKKYAAVQAEIAAGRDRAVELRDRLLALIDRDAAAFAPLAAAYGLPAETEAQKDEKQAVLEAASLTACQPPLDIMTCCGDVVALAELMAEKGSVMAVSDAAAAAALAAGAIRAASLNVYINTKSMIDRAAAARLNAQADGLMEDILPRAETIFVRVRTRLCGTMEE